MSALHEGLLAGALLGTSFFGVATVQLALYSPRLWNDSRIVKFLVFSPWVLLGIQVVFVLTSLYLYTMSGFVNPAGPHYVPWTQVIYDFAGVLSSALVQTFYVWRIYQLNKTLLIILPLVFLILLKLVLGSLVSCWLIVKPTSFVGLHIVLIVKLWLISDVVLDIIIVLFLSFSLFRHRTGFRNTDAIITRLARYALHTGLVTSVLCTVNLISYCKAGLTGAAVALSLTTCSMYVVAMLANLHTRSDLNRMFEVNEMTPIQLSNLAREMHGQTTGTPGELSSSSACPRNGSGVTKVFGHDFEDYSNVDQPLT